MVDIELPVDRIKDYQYYRYNIIYCHGNNMIFRVPELSGDCLTVLGLINGLREKLRFSTSDNINRWGGLLARTSYARAIQGSNAVEGINVTLDEAIAAVDRQSPEKTGDDDFLAVWGYREAMDYVIQLSKDGNHLYNSGTLLALHYMMLKHDLNSHPGRWRPGAIFVTNTGKNETVYTGPDADLVPGLIEELLQFLNNKDDVPILAKAAMAHLNLAMIHPFKDGNGRMARALQTMVLAREGILSPVFSSIEEYVGRNSQDYYAVLGEVGQGAWHPENDATPWVKFCLTAHYRQARTLLRRMTEIQRLWNALEVEVKKRKLHERMIFALADAAIGLRVKNSAYRQQVEISLQLAKLDLRSLTNSGFLVPHGESRGRYYVASATLEAIYKTVQLPRERFDPFRKIADKRKPTQPDLPGLESAGRNP
ncbi:MAG: Fic family protein [Acidiferrobacterales bacterium]